MAKPCDMCGDLGVIEAIITCCECKVAREHLYCMRVVRTQAPPFWRCEECEQTKSVSTQKTVEAKLKTQKVSVLMEKTTRVKDAFATQSNFKERNVITGRTKFITCEEAVKLSSGTENTSRNPKRCENGRELKTANSELLPISCQKPEKHNTKTANSELLPISCQKPEKRNTKTANSEFLPKSSHKPGKPDTKTACKNHDNVEAWSSARVERNALSVTEKHSLYIPVLHSYWKGNFYLPNGHENFNNAFKAHPPTKVLDKVYETLLKMPENLYFELVPNHQVYMEIFSGCCPEDDDIGLYFFPRFKNRLENNNSMTRFLWRENLVMKSIVNGVELLVFSSRLLQSNYQEFQGNYFLWGVFRRPKIVEVVVDSRPLKEAKREHCDDLPPGFQKVFKPWDNAPPGVEKIFKTCDDVPPGFENISKHRG